MKRIIRYEARFTFQPEGGDVQSFATKADADALHNERGGAAFRGIGVYVRQDHGNGLPDGMLEHIADVESEADAARLVEHLTALAGGRNLIESLLSELRYVQTTGDIRDSEKNSLEVLDQAAIYLGFPDYESFGKSCDSE